MPKTKKAKPELVEVKISIDWDSDADTSTLGEWVDSGEDGVIARKLGKYWEDLTEEEHGQIPESGNEYRFFKPYAGGEEITSEYYKPNGLQDWERMEGLNRGDWGYTCVEAIAVVQINARHGIFRHRFNSGALHGIESDSEQSFYDEVASDQLTELKDVLEAFGVKVKKKEWKGHCKKALADIKC